MNTCHIRVPAQVLATLPPVWLPADVFAWETAEDGPITWVLATHGKDSLLLAPGFTLAQLKSVKPLGH